MIKELIVKTFYTFLLNTSKAWKLRKRAYFAHLINTEILKQRLEKARTDGMKVGKDCLLFSYNVFSEPYLVELGDNVSVSALVKFMTPDDGVFIVPDWSKTF